MSAGKEREYWIGRSEFYLGEDNILYETIVGDIDEKYAIAARELTLKLMGMIEGKAKVLVDLNHVGKPSAEARRIGREMFENEKTEMIALFGLHPVARVIASFLMGVTRKKNMRFFKSKEEALAWLQEGNKNDCSKI